MHQFDFPCNFYESVFKTICTVDGLRQKKALSTNFRILLNICQKQPFDIIVMAPRGTLALCCVHIAQLVTHPAVYTLPFTLQLCYKLLGILQRVTNSQKIHISSHDALQNLIRSTFNHVYNILSVFWWLSKLSFTTSERKYNKLVCTSCQTT